MTHLRTPAEMQKDTHNNSFYILNRDYDSFSKKWFETEISFPPSLVMEECVDYPASPLSQPSSFRTDPYYMGFEETDQQTYGE